MHGYLAVRYACYRRWAGELEMCREKSLAGCCRIARCSFDAMRGLRPSSKGRPIPIDVDGRWRCHRPRRSSRASRCAPAMFRRFPIEYTGRRPGDAAIGFMLDARQAIDEKK
ncbi:hypothetical protein ACI2U6_22010 [Ralstonia nicotianae]